MKQNRLISGLIVSVLALLVTAPGCRQPANPDKEVAKNDKAKETGPKHGEWWCTEHGVPEEMCSLCSADVAKDLKAKGDWCDIHDRAQSQCFKCDPTKYDRFAAMYKAKFGQDPPRPPKEEFEK